MPSPEPAPDPDVTPPPRRCGGLTRARVLRGLALVAVWAVVSVAVAVALFLNSSRTVVLASHDAKVRPTLDGYVVLHTGPVLPDFRARLRCPDRGRRDARQDQRGLHPASCVQRYAYIASQPEGQIAKVQRLDRRHGRRPRPARCRHRPAAGRDLAGARAGPATGPARRGQQLARAVVGRAGPGRCSWPWSGSRGAAASRPWLGASEWTPLPDYLGAGVPVPEQAAGPRGPHRRDDVEQSAADPERGRHLRQEQGVLRHRARRRGRPRRCASPRRARRSSRWSPTGTTTSAWTRVARAVADAGGATAVFDAGDDTSTGERWEAFSLDSVTSAFEDLDRYGVAGNHDHGSFVTDYLSDLGWTMLDGEVVEGPGGSTLLGVNDPRSSGLGNWRDESGLSFERGRQPAVRRRLRVRGAGVDDPRPRRQPRRRGARARLRRPGRRRPPARAGGADAGGRRERPDRLLLHDRHDRGSGVRDRDRQQAPPRGDDHAADLPRRPPGRHPAGGAADRRHVRGRSYYALELSE